MSDYVGHVVQEFSTFCVPIVHTNGARFILQSESKLKNLLTTLVDADWEVGIDAWARYFLLVGQYQDDQLQTALNLSGCNLSGVLARLAELSPVRNQETPIIDRQLTARRNNQRIKRYLDDPIPESQKALTAHLHKVARYAANRFPGNQEDAFAIASILVSQPFRLLKSFDFVKQPIQVKTYAERVLQGKIKDVTLNKDIAARTKQFSDEGLLKNVTKKEMKEAIAAKDYPMEAYCLMWQSFQEICPVKRADQKRSSQLTDEQLQQIADRYNQRCQSFPDLRAIDPAQVKSCLQEMAHAIRTYRSADACMERIFNQSQETSNPLDDLLQAEEQDILKTIVNQVLANQSIAVQTALQLWLGLDLSQDEVLFLMGPALGIKKQYEISRKIIKPLLKAMMAAWQEQHLDQLMSDKGNLDSQIEQQRKALNAYLSQQYKADFHQKLAVLFQQLTTEQQICLRSRYRSSLDPSQIAEQLNQPLAAIEAHVVEAMCQLEAGLAEWIETHRSVVLDQVPTTRQKLHRFIDLWCQNVPLEPGDSPHVKHE